MDKYYSCPNCDEEVRDSFGGGVYFDVYECRSCDKLYCYKCPGTNQGRKCPKCGDGDSRVTGRVWKR